MPNLTNWLNRKPIEPPPQPDNPWERERQKTMEQRATERMGVARDWLGNVFGKPSAWSQENVRAPVVAYDPRDGGGSAGGPDEIVSPFGPSSSPWSGSAAELPTKPIIDKNPWKPKPGGPELPTTTGPKKTGADAGTTSSARQKALEETLAQARAITGNPNLTLDEWTQLTADMSDEELIKQAGIVSSGSPSQPTQSSSKPSAYNGYDQNWIAAFQKKHGGRDPVEQYTSGPNPTANSAEEALWEADWDRRWAEDFQRKHGVPPSDAAWNDSYWQRRNMKEGGAYPSAPY